MSQVGHNEARRSQSSKAKPDEAQSHAVGARRRAATVCRPPLGVLRIMSIWRSNSLQNQAMDDVSQPWRKLGVVSRRSGSKTADEGVSESPNASSSSSMPSLLEACQQCHEDVVRRLLKNGISKAELNARDKTGKTGLSHACSNGFVTIANLLKSRDIDVNLADNEGNHPLIFAAQAGHADIVSLLLNCFPGVILDQPNHQGFTALMKAAVQGRARCARLLLYAGATPYARDYGRSLCALEWAEYCGRHSTAKVIAQFMEACNLGLVCTAAFASRQQSQDEKQRNQSTSSQKTSRRPSFRVWRSESCLTSSSCDTLDEKKLGCMPFQLFRRVRRSLPNSGSETAEFSPLQSLEEIGRLCYTPVFPEYASPPTSRKSSSLCSRRNRLIVPKVEITLTSKDDNFFYETPLPFARSPTLYRKYLENVESCHDTNNGRGV